MISRGYFIIQQVEKHHLDQFYYSGGVLLHVFLSECHLTQVNYVHGQPASQSVCYSAVQHARNDATSEKKVKLFLLLLCHAP